MSDFTEIAVFQLKNCFVREFPVFSDKKCKYSPRTRDCITQLEAGFTYWFGLFLVFLLNLAFWAVAELA